VSTSATPILARLSNTPLRIRGLGAAALGALATSAMPPWSIVPVLWIALPGFLILLNTATSWRSAAGLGWLFGFGFFATGFGWITNAFYVDRETFAALAVPAVGGLAAGFALYIAICGFIFWAMRPRGQTTIVSESGFYLLAVASVWTLVEWWRGWFLTGLPWNPMGSTWTETLPVLQGASVFGVYGLSFITVVAASSLMLLSTTSKRRIAIALIAVTHAPLGMIAVWGTQTLSGAQAENVADVMLRLVQPNIAQADKWLPEQRAQHVFNQVAMSTLEADGITHVLWAETAVPFFLNTADEALAVVARASPLEGMLLTGAPRLSGSGDTRNLYNSLFALNAEGVVRATYDKAHLVPFGEYMPLREYIPIPQLTGGSGFSAGPGPVTLNLDGLPPVSPLICYEVIFAGNVTAGDDRPAWLFNLTNDAWFGESSGPFQHLAAAQLRAVEEGLPLVRVANTGISAVIDSRGRILKSIPIGTQGVIDHPLPGALPPTLFARYGHWPLLTLCITILIAAGLARRNVSKNANNSAT